VEPPFGWKEWKSTVFSFMADARGMDDRSPFGEPRRKNGDREFR
jgi:hypothetical protein